MQAETLNTNVTGKLSAPLADYQVFYQKARSYHWNVKGPLFFQLHEEFEKLYTALAEKIDELAERVSARGAVPPATLKQILEQARLEEDASVPEAQSMVENLQRDLEHLNVNLRSLVDEALLENDVPTANLLEDYADEQAKTIWMYQAFLGA